MTKQNTFFGEYIKNRRQELDKSQRDLAKLLGVSQNFITYLEKGIRRPTDKMLQKLSMALALPLDKLYLKAHPEVPSMVGFEPNTKTLKSEMPPMLKELAEDKELKNRHQITEQEIKMLHTLQLRGEVKKKEDYVFILMSIRQVMS